MCAQALVDTSQPSVCCLVPFFKSTSVFLQSTCCCCKTQRLLSIICELIYWSRVGWQNRRSWKCIKSSWIVSRFSTSSMISLHDLATKLRTKASVPIHTPIPTKLSGQNEARATSTVRCVNVGLVVRMLCATSKAACWVMPLGRITVLRRWAPDQDFPSRRPWARPGPGGSHWVWPWCTHHRCMLPPEPPGT